MSSVQEPEVQLAQRLASNEKPVRTRAIKKLRKYISVRSQREAGGFSGDELLKLWKGLFYCLWMQDKPLLQEELSNQISTLIHSFDDIDGQLLYLESFLQTLKREWTGIDRLRMDKFFQLVRFMFRRTFEALKRKNWDNSAVAKFLDLLTLNLLQNGSEVPCGLQLHILDLYLTELAAVGSEELSADQNLMFINPFCKTAAKTKNRTLFREICSSIFSTIIDQAPFAIEDLMKEVKAAEAMDSDSGRASEEDDECEREEKTRRGGGKQMNGNKSNKEEEDFDDEEELLPLEDSDTELQHDEDVGPVLQFDYTALADKLFELASRSSTPGQNRQRLYKIIKVLRDLSEGIFPQGDYPEEVSTDEDDEMFGSRKRMKRVRHRKDVEDGAPTGKKNKAHTGEEDLKQNKSSESADVPVTRNKKKKKKKKKAKANCESLVQEQTGAPAVSRDIDAEESLENAQDLVKDVKLQSSISTVKVTEDPSETLLLSELKRQPSVRVTEYVDQPEPCTTSCKNKLKKKKKLKAEAEISSGSSEVSEDPTAASPEANAVTSAKIKKKGRKAKTKPESEVPVNDGSSSADISAVGCTHLVDDVPTPGLEKMSDDAAAIKKKTTVSLKANEVQTAVADSVQAEAVSSHNEITAGSPVTAEKTQFEMNKTASTKKKKKKSVKLTAAQLNEIRDESPELPSIKAVGKTSGKAAKKKRKIPVEFEFEADELAETTLSNGVAAEKTPVKKKKLGIKNLTPKSLSKKVTFGLKNNKTAEFRKTDRSLLLSPDGSSRVPFDPKQRPKFGVLKSPSDTVSTSCKKTPSSKKKTSSKTQKSTLKQRPLAADFF
ncbi:ribosomal RNA processing protein 1 homolog B-like isoform X2 [Leuresthes tenuis]|uniref:ribosomal RNA processing protein 1 homolog B-like isoform X2 n=1 Tax=Leuresthes tenuis TaxID=355514 RepID=UPI003B50E4A2